MLFELYELDELRPVEPEMELLGYIGVLRAMVSNNSALRTVSAIFKSFCTSVLDSDISSIG